MLSMALRRVPALEGLLSPSRLLLPATFKSEGFGSQKSESRAPVCCPPSRHLSLSSALSLPFEKNEGPRKWPKLNKILFAPQELEEERRPAYVCHMTTNIKYPHWKMWYIACLIRGMTVDEAIRQLDYVHKKGAYFIKQTLLEARELAVQEHHVEFRSNLWVAESFCTKGVVVKEIRRHARKRVGLVEYFHCHYFVRLEEGTPPEHYYTPKPDGPTLLQRWIHDRRRERVFNSL